MRRIITLEELGESSEADKEDAKRLLLEGIEKLGGMENVKKLPFPDVLMELINYALNKKFGNAVNIGKMKVYATKDNPQNSGRV